MDVVLTQEQESALWKVYRKEIEGLQEAHDKTVGGELNEFFDQLKTSYEIYDENFKELLKLLEDYRNPKIGMALWSGTLKPERDDRVRVFLGKVIRALHNYLAAVSTLTDHTTAITEEVADKYDAKIFGENYKIKVGSFFEKSSR